MGAVAMAEIDKIRADAEVQRQTEELRKQKLMRSMNLPTMKEFWQDVGDPPPGWTPPPEMLRWMKQMRDDPKWMDEIIGAAGPDTLLPSVDALLGPAVASTTAVAAQAGLPTIDMLLGADGVARMAPPNAAVAPPVRVGDPSYPVAPGMGGDAATGVPTPPPPAAWNAVDNLKNAFTLGAVPAARAAGGVTADFFDDMRDNGLSAAVEGAGRNYWAYKNYTGGGQKDFYEKHPGQAIATEVVGSLPAAVLGGRAVTAFGEAVAAPYIAGNAGYAGNQMLPGAANLGRRVLSGGTSGSLQGLTTGMLTAPLRNQAGDDNTEIGLGVAVNALLGAAAPAVRQGYRAARGAVDPRLAELADWAMKKGIPVFPWQVSGSNFRKGVASTADVMPGSGRPAQTTKQMAGFNRTLASTIGEEADDLSPPVLLRAFTRITGDLNSAAQRTGVKIDPKFVTDLDEIRKSARWMMPRERALVEDMLDELVSPGAGNTLIGEKYKALTTKGGPLSMLTNSGNGNVASLAMQMRSKLDDALERSSPKDAVDALREARHQYKNLIIVEKLAAEAGPTGEITPGQMNKLFNAVRNKYKDMPYDIGMDETGDIGRLAQFGQHFIKEPSGAANANQHMIRNALLGVFGGGVGGFGAGMAMGQPLLSTAVGLAAPVVGIGGMRALNTATSRQSTTQAIVDRSLGRVARPASPYTKPTLQSLVTHGANRWWEEDEPK